MQAVRDYIKATGMNQAKFAARVGVSRSAVTLWLQGKRTPTEDQLDIISARTGIDRQKLVDAKKAS